MALHLTVQQIGAFTPVLVLDHAINKEPHKIAVGVQTGGKMEFKFQQTQILKCVLTKTHTGLITFSQH